MTTKRPSMNGQGVVLYGPDGLPLVTVDRGTGGHELATVDACAVELLRELLVQTRLVRMHLEVVTGEKLTEQDLEAT